MKPSKIEDIVWPDSREGAAIVKQITAGELRDNLLLYGPPGTGKTELTRLIARQLRVPELNQHRLEGGDIGKPELEALQKRLEMTWAFAEPGAWDRRLVIIDEVDMLTPAALSSLKGKIDNNRNSVRWLFTTNKIDVIRSADPALVDRCREVKMDFAGSKEGQAVFVAHLERLGVPNARLVAASCKYNYRQLEQKGVFDD